MSSETTPPDDWVDVLPSWSWSMPDNQTTVPHDWVDVLWTWSFCETAVDEGRANALQRFIYDNEPAAPEKAREFRWRLGNVVLEASRGR